MGAMRYIHTRGNLLFYFHLDNINYELIADIYIGTRLFYLFFIELI